MEKLVYLILSRDKDRFNIIYAGDCEKTDNVSFFTQHTSFKCWLEHTSVKSLYLAILPLSESSKKRRFSILNKITTRYNPICNTTNDVKPDYTVRSTKLPLESEKFSCPCCGSEMKQEKVLEKSTLYRCSSCGISDTKLNS